MSVRACRQACIFVRRSALVHAMRKLLVIVGGVLLLAGLAWPWLKSGVHRSGCWLREHIGHLPGDIHIEREGYSFHFPLMTCVLVSVLVSALFWLLRRI